MTHQQKVCFKRCQKKPEEPAHDGEDLVFQTMKEMDFERGPWEAASIGDYAKVLAYLDKGGLPNMRDSAGYTPLVIRFKGILPVVHVIGFDALIYNKSIINNVLQYLLQAECFTNKHYSARNGHDLITKALLNHGANVNAETRASKATPLHRAARNNSVKVAEMLLEHNADPCKQDADGKTPLHKAVEGKSGEICRLLIEKNPKCAEIQDKFGKEAKYYIRGTLEDSEVYKAVKWRR